MHKNTTYQVWVCAGQRWPCSLEGSNRGMLRVHLGHITKKCCCTSHCRSGEHLWLWMATRHCTAYCRHRYAAGCIVGNSYRRMDDGLVCCGEHRWTCFMHTRTLGRCSRNGKTNLSTRICWLLIGRTRWVRLCNEVWWRSSKWHVG